MIFITNTPKTAGVAVHGDLLDFEELYHAIHEIIGEEEDFPAFYAARIRILGFCYEIRHSLMGSREAEFVDNGLDEEMMKQLSVIAPNKNVYLLFKMLWPEMLFVTMALNDFAILQQKKCKYPQWDPITIAVRKLQAAFAVCVQQTVSAAAANRMSRLMIRDYTWFDNYADQYLDILNDRFVKLDPEKRLKQLPIVTKRLAEQGAEYLQLKSDMEDAARENQCSINDIELEIDDPGDIDW